MFLLVPVVLLSGVSVKSILMLCKTEANIEIDKDVRDKLSVRQLASYLSSAV